MSTNQITITGNATRDAAHRRGHHMDRPGRGTHPPCTAYSRTPQNGRNRIYRKA